ncbi:MAG TPA: sigma-70 family RNA polymerase sigma factor [Caulobacteraceae bacterium]|nr:sigma-70 family RNA polymerase sigma factor [Caulobacteraceae bacterium]
MPPPNKQLDEGAAFAVEQVRAWSAQYGPALRRYFLKKVGPNEAEDLVQEVFLSLQLRGQGGGEIENIEGYLFRTAANAIVRRHQRQKWDWAGHDILDDIEEDLSDDVSPERVLMGKEELDRVLAAMHGLPPRCAQAFFLHRFEELTYSAIAVRMRITTSAVERLIQRALRRISLTVDPEL